MNKSYYTSLCRAWLDHDVLAKPTEMEKFIEMLVEKKDRREYICEWIINQLQKVTENNKTQLQLLEHLENIDFIKVAEALCDEYLA